MLFNFKFMPVKFTPPRVLVTGFALLILGGALLLTLPFCTVSGEGTDFLTALFTATSAVCVTGLVVVDTGTYWSTAGQVIILVLIQVGGLGIMTTAALFFLLAGRRIGLRERLLLQESLNQLSVQGVVRLVRAVLIFTFATELLFAFILSWRFSQDLGWERGLWYGFFHAVSAFNNAGFDLMGDFRSLTGYVNDPVVNLAISLLIIIGGIGFSVVMELYEFPRRQRLTVHTRLVLLMTVFLLATAMSLILLIEWNSALQTLPLSGKLLAAWFQAVVPRTAGFNTLDLTSLQTATIWIMILLMFIGASPGSTGGGVKTSTFGLILVAAVSLVRGKEEAEIFYRRIPAWQVYKALALFLWAVGVVVSAVFLLTITEKGQDFIKILFETVSAFGTVGLSLGLTPQLSVAGRIIIILTMFTGRLGPLTVAYALVQRRQPGQIRYPEEKILIG